jgi:hypothetical protein
LDDKWTPPSSRRDPPTQHQLDFRETRIDEKI